MHSFSRSSRVPPSGSQPCSTSGASAGRDGASMRPHSAHRRSALGPTSAAKSSGLGSPPLRRPSSGGRSASSP
eukprot:5791642-Prymnesium_polylepis.1